MRGQDTRQSEAGERVARHLTRGTLQPGTTQRGRAGRAGASGLLLLVLVGLWSSDQPAASPWPLHPVARRRDTATAARIPFPPVQWKALLLAGDDSIDAFDHAIDALATLFAQHHITVVQQFSTNPSKLSATVHLATIAQLQAAIPTLQVQPGEGCLIYATSHGTVKGLTLARDPTSGYRLRPTQLHQVVQAACGEAPTILVLSGCYTGTFLRDELLGPNLIVLTAAAADRPSFGCRAEASYTYYDGCFLREFDTAPTWQALHRAVSRCVAVAERALRAPASAPQAFFGLWMHATPIPRP